ncbi:MAG: protein kinase [Gemmatales bacterium]|nr:MAG: protein kinase [Gemmatales bacterium]
MYQRICTALRWLALLLLAVTFSWASQQSLCAQTGPPNLPPATPPPSSSAPQQEGASIWIYVGAVVALGVIGAIIALVVLQPNKSKKEPTLSYSSERLGDYRLLNLLMTGQTSQVWEVAEISSGRHFAIKMLLPECAKVAEHRRFLFHEAEVGQQLAHPNIIRVVRIVRDPNVPHFVMDFFPGGNLKLRILRKEWDFIKEHAQEILKQAATALAFINAKGWVHRDVKPDNLLVSSSGETRVIDLAIAQRIPTGLAKIFRKKGKIQGTRSYMSPEQIRNEPLDGRADIYSFGATCYEIVTGRPPFRGTSAQDLLNKHLTEKPISPRVHNPEVTEEFAQLVLQMLAKNKEHRPQSFHEVLMALRKIRVFSAVKKSKT